MLTAAREGIIERTRRDDEPRESAVGAGTDEHRKLWAAVVLGVVVRASLALTTSYNRPDRATFGSWAQTLSDHPLGDFYGLASNPDHLPGDLWVLKLLQVGYNALGGRGFMAPGFELLLKSVPIAADLVIGILLFGVVRVLASRKSATRAAQWYLLNPGVVILSGVWGQWDALSAAILLLGLFVLLRGGRFRGLAAPFLVWAVLVKPPLAIVELVLLVGLVIGARRADHGQYRRFAVSDALLAIGSGLATAWLLVSPFRVGLLVAPADGWTLWERVHVAAETHRFTTVGAANIWLVLDRRVIGPADDVARWGSLTPATVGAILLVLLISAIGVTAWRTRVTGRGAETLLWTALMATFASCLVLTRVHERYYFPVLVLLLLWASVRRSDAIANIYYWLFSVLFVFDLAMPMGKVGHDDRFLHQPGVLAVLGLLHVILFSVLLARPWRRRPAGVLKDDARSAATGARRTAPG